MPSTNALYNLVPAGSAVNYNGYEFSQYRSLDWNAEPVYDEADRARTGVKYTLTIHSLVTSPDQATGAKTIDGLRCTLTRPGAVLTVKGIGFGDMVIGGARATEQVLDWGPKPRMLHFQPMGGVLSYEMVWTCEFTIAECCGSGINGSLGLSAPAPISAWNASTIYSVDDRGLTIRTVTGYFEIPSGSRLSAASPTVAVTADFYRDKVLVVLPFGFRRVHSDWHLSANQRRMEFSVVDAELEGDDFLPPGIVRGSFERTLANSRDYDFLGSWTYTLNAMFERAAGTSRDWAFQKWFLIIGTMIQQIQQNLYSQDQGASSGQTNTGTVLPARISLSTNAYTRVSRMSVTLQVIRSTYDIVTATGMWAPLSGNAAADYALWAGTLSKKLWTSRGNAQLFHNASTDAIIDPCVSAPMVVSDSQPANAIASNYPVVMGCGNITKNTSWLHYANWLEVRKDNQIVEHNPLQNVSSGAGVDDGEGNFTFTGAASSTGQSGTSGSTGGASIGSLDAAQPPDQATDFSDGTTTMGRYGTYKYPPIIQQRKAPKTEVAMVGSAMRVKIEPAIPTLLSFGGQPVVELRRYITGPRVLGSLVGCDIYGANWRIEYAVRGIPKDNTTVYDQPRPSQNSLTSQDKA